MEILDTINQVTVTNTIVCRELPVHRHIPFARRGFPILLLQCPGAQDQSLTLTRCNRIQCQLAFDLLRELCRIRPRGRICISTYYMGDCRRIATLMRLSEPTESLHQADLIRVASAEVNVGNDFEINIIVTGAPEALRGTVILTELENAIEYPLVLFDNRRFMNTISRSNGMTIIIGNHDHLASQVDMEDRNNLVRNALISHFVRQISTNTPVLNGNRYLRELQQLVLDNRNTRPRYNEGGILIAHELPLRLRATNQLNQMNNWHQR